MLIFPEEVRFYQKSWISEDRTILEALKSCSSLKICILIDESKAFHRFGTGWVQLLLHKYKNYTSKILKTRVLSFFHTFSLK